jgi:hypothetical protein
MCRRILIKRLMRMQNIEKPLSHPKLATEPEQLTKRAQKRERGVKTRMSGSIQRFINYLSNKVQITVGIEWRADCLAMEEATAP